MRIGICGGTFDPFHRGHFDPILSARGTMNWDRVVYVPAHRQPFKADRETATAFDRFAMTVLATEDASWAYVSPVELQRGAISYTVDTLRHFREELQHDATIDWIIGDDNLEQLGEWKSIDTIFELANFAVLSRNGGESLVPAPFRERIADPSDRPPCGTIVFAENATVPVSSTEVRRKLRENEPIDALVDGRVARYIHHYGLYRKGRS